MHFSYVNVETDLKDEESSSEEVPVAYKDIIRNPKQKTLRQEPQMWCWFCRPKTWSNIIAAISIVTSVISVLWGVAGKDHDYRENAHYGASNEVTVMTGSIGIIWGCLLLRGAKKKKPGLLTIWLVAHRLGICFVVFGLILAASVEGLNVVFAILLVDLTWRIFCFLAVYTYRQELVALQGPSPQYV